VKPTRVHTFARSKFPITLTLYSHSGVELWSKTLTDPGEDLGVIDVPGFGGTEHAPVRCVIVYGDGTSEAY
jgi:hypothetical protein